jgi:hypothetical protein
MARASRTFRVFVSSTFSDLKAERSALQERVFPKLKQLCLEHSAQFQAIDLRWGVSEEAAFDQQTMNSCLCKGWTLVTGPCSLESTEDVWRNDEKIDAY